MATESLPESASISLENWVVSLGTVIAKSSEESLYPASNLTLFDRTERWWTTDSTTDGTVDVQLTSAKIPTFFSLGDSNLDAAETVTLIGSENSLFNGTGNDLTWTFTTWAQSDIGKLLRWYMGDPDSGSAAAREYWRLKLPANGTADANHKLGAFWLGEHDDFLLAPGWTERPINPARWVGRYRVHRELGIETTSRLAWDPYYTFKEKLEKLSASQQKHCILDLHGNTTTDAIKKVSARYGIIEGGSVRSASQHADNSEVSWTFQETHEEYLGGA